MSTCKFRKLVLSSSCQLALVVGLTAGTGISVAAQTEAAAAKDEIIVTARRQSESLRDVPGTVSVLTQARLENAGVARADDFIEMTPGVTMVNAAEAGDTQVNIRGINGARDAENSFAFIVDGVLYTNPAAFNREYINLKQIEVFKGPQGALYGRNAAAGAIIITTEKPGNETHGKLSVSAAEDNTYVVKGGISGALSQDTVFASLSGDWRKSDGFYRNSFQGGAPVVDAFESYNLNGRILWQPSDALSVDIKARIGDIDASAITFNSTFNLPVFASATNNPPAFQDVNDFDFLFQPNIISDNDQSAKEFSAKFDYKLDNTTLTGWALFSDIENNLISDGTSAAFGFYAPDAACQQSVTDLNAAGIQLLAPQFIGTSPVGVIFDPTGSFLGAYTPTTCDGIQEQLRDQRDFSAELRWASDQDGPLQWMVGGYFLDIDRQVGVSLNRDSGAAPVRGLFQNGGPNATASLTHDDFDSSVLAVFGQVQFDVSDDFEISVAARYDSEKRKVSSLVPTNVTQSVIDLNFDGIFNDPLNPALSSLINPAGTIPDKEQTFSALQPKISATWDASDNLTLFGNWGKGFKAGGFNNSGSAATIDIFINGFINGGIGINFADNLGVPLPVIGDNFKKETSSAFEAGFKANLMDGTVRLSGAAYKTDVTDMQFFEFLVGSFGLLRVVSNIDKVNITGFELAIDGRVNDNLHLYASGSWIDSQIKANASRPDTVGNKSPYTPDYTINLGGDLTWPLSDNMSLTAHANAQFIGPTWFHTVQGGQRPTIFMPLFELGFGAGAGALGTADFSNARRDAYTTLNARLGLNINNWSITAFVDNFTDEKYLEEVIPAPEFGGSFNHPGAQRRFGAEITTKF